MGASTMAARRTGGGNFMGDMKLTEAPIFVNLPSTVMARRNTPFFQHLFLLNAENMRT
jgi:hypothetical protein